MRKTQNTKNLIQVGIFSVIYFIVMMINVIFTHFVPVTLIFLPITLALTEGIVFALYMTRVNKRGMIFLLGFIMSVILVMTGHVWLTIVISSVCSIIAEIIIFSGEKKTFSKIAIGYSFFQLWPISMYLQLWLSKEAYLAKITKRLGADFAAMFEKLTSVWVIICFIIAIMIAAIIGIYIGKSVCKNKFKQAGII